MNKQEAWNVLAQIGAQFKDNLQDHNTIQQALQVLKSIEYVQKLPGKPLSKTEEKKE